MTTGETSADNVVSGYVAQERITLGVTPAGTTFAWSVAQPSSSSRARSALSSGSGANPTITPDVGGTYTITCLVDGSITYVLRLTVQAAAVAEPVEAVRFSPRTDASIPAPAAGITMYYSSDQDALCVKAPDDSVSTVDLTAVP
jgi:hypothetical protein